jgi:sugar-specific transcriptional regulator TrmB
VEKLKEVLQSIGFKKSEVDIYISLIKLKEATVFEISKDTQIHRSNVYEALERLINQGLVIEITQPKRLFRAKEPEIIEDFLNQKKTELKDAIKSLDLNKSGRNEETKIGLLKGKISLRHELFLLLQTKEEILCYGFPENTPKILGPLFYEFNKERKLKKINMKIIYNSTAKELAKKGKKERYTKTRNMPKKYDEKLGIIISETIVLLLLLEPEINIIKINDQDVSNFYKKQFSLLWKTSCC